MSSPSTFRGITAGVYVFAVLPEGDVLRQPEGVVLIVQSTYANCIQLVCLARYASLVCIT